MQFRFTNNRIKRPRQNFGGLYCPKCGGLMRAGSTREQFTYYYCGNDHCLHSEKVTRPK